MVWRRHHDRIDVIAVKQGLEGRLDTYAAGDLAHLGRCVLTGIQTSGQRQSVNLIDRSGQPLSLITAPCQSNPDSIRFRHLV
jgi:hypothetical protein